MSRAPIASVVADELEILSVPGGLLHSQSVRSTFSMYSAGQRALRAAKIGSAYRARQEGVATSGQAAVVTAGPPGAGKTTALERADLGSSYRNIDPDIVKEFLLQLAIEDGIFDDLLSRLLADGLSVQPMELAGLVHSESVAIAQNITEVSMQAGENVIIQGSLAWDGQPEYLLGQLDRYEYVDLTIVDVEVDLASALERSIDRWWMGRNDPLDVLGGRYVPRYLITDLYLTQNKTKCATNADVLMALSANRTTQLRRSTFADGLLTETVTTKNDGVQEAGTKSEV